ncbi:hypothetical protein H9L14_14200 [Sphingomonas sediminicola]|uniref:Uncharacterized protein n=1 Tax=Sphingomonas sediminicola TaxID=386874 RepID=A0ABX6T7W4_9SPHN|nr:hypothetical protein [Sphingomonas sediminicola]QNP45654.1 hypothetical protein H9L14_14200 [Sphingomonas sediminicola]
MTYAGIALAWWSTGKQVESAAALPALRFLLCRKYEAESLEVRDHLLQPLALQIVGVVTAEVCLFGKGLATDDVVPVREVRRHRVLVELVDEHRRETGVFHPSESPPQPANKSTIVNPVASLMIGTWFLESSVELTMAGSRAEVQGVSGPSRIWTGLPDQATQLHPGRGAGTDRTASSRQTLI